MVEIISLVFGAVGLIGVYFAGVDFFEKRRARRLGISVKATINGTYYEDGWRSAQLHVVPSQSDRQGFQYRDWRIERARLIGPSSAVLARAEDDDYATGVFYPANPVRDLAGKAEGRPQRFALEFFIKFEGEDRGKTATFRVTYLRSDGRGRRTVRVSAMVPDDAALRPAIH